MFHNIPYANRGMRDRNMREPRDRPGVEADQGAGLCAAPDNVHQPARGATVTAKVRKLESRETAAALETPTDLSEKAVQEIPAALNALLADTIALYVKTKNFHWHVSGPNF